jgi:hypothetical protein
VMALVGGGRRRLGSRGAAELGPADGWLARPDQFTAATPGTR